ncbi:DUSP16 [Symbiodinium sp. CCMP2592]|nr:DUSP16 [Symbiodinium sp. CCMP2592]
MASAIVPDTLYLGPEVAVAETVGSLRCTGHSVLVIRCMECEPDTPAYVAALAPNELDCSASKTELLHLVLRDEAEQALMDAIDSATAAVARWLCLPQEAGREGATGEIEDAGDCKPASAKLECPRHAVVVHCAAGVSRSASIVTALVMTFGVRLCGSAVLDPQLSGPQPRSDGGPVGLERALSFVASRRPVISPNEGFLEQLMAYEARLRAGGGDDGLQPSFDPILNKVRTVAAVCAVTPELARRALDSAGMDINRAAEFIFTGAKKATAPEIVCKMALGHRRLDMRSQYLAKGLLWLQDENDPAVFSDLLQDLTGCLDLLNEILDDPAAKEASKAHVQPFAYLARDAAKRLKDRLSMTVQEPSWVDSVSHLQKIADNAEKRLTKLEG